MNKRPVYFLFALLLAIALSSCTSKVDISKMENQEALEYLDAKLAKDPDNAELLYQRGVVQIKIGKEKNLSQYYKAAIADLTKATGIDKTHSDYFTALGDAHFSLGHVGESYSALQQALKIDTGNFEARLKLGEIAFYSKDYDLAMENLNHVTARDKTNQTALFMKGFIYKETGDTANAVHYFRRLIDLYPEYEPAYEELGMLYAQYRNKLGLEYLNTALQLQPQNINVLYGLAMMYQEAGDCEKAEQYYTDILAIDPNYKYAWFNRGWIYLEVYHDYPNALEFFTKAVDCDPDYADAHYNRGITYERMGDKTRANQCFDEAKRLGYDN